MPCVNSDGSLTPVAAQVLGALAAVSAGGGGEARPHAGGEREAGRRSRDVLTVAASQTQGPTVTRTTVVRSDPSAPASSAMM
jgi:hypothetical protein